LVDKYWDEQRRTCSSKANASRAHDREPRKASRTERDAEQFVAGGRAWNFELIDCERERADERDADVERVRH
jgi:hypothetical protein